MILFAIYMSVMIFGFFVGKVMDKKKIEITWASKFQYIAIIVLLVTMGARIGANKEIVTQLGSIGIIAVAITIAVFIGSILALFLMRKIMKLDRKGKAIK
ncbi:MAG: LysO family transporter [Anaerovoracaceae bacterium]